MKIFIASDHRGFHIKEKIKEWLKGWGYNFEDCGAFELREDDDYPDFISKAAKKVSESPVENRAIVLGATGQGEAMLANKYKGVRAAVYCGGSEEMITLSRQHNDANVLSLGADFLSDKEAKKAIELWLKTEFSGEERHKRRIGKIGEVERKT